MNQWFTGCNCSWSLFNSQRCQHRVFRLSGKSSHYFLKVIRNEYSSFFAYWRLLETDLWFLNLRCSLHLLATYFLKMWRWGNSLIFILPLGVHGMHCPFFKCQMLTKTKYACIQQLVPDEESTGEVDTRTLPAKFDLTSVISTDFQLELNCAPNTEDTCSWQCLEVWLLLRNAAC